MRLMRSTVRRSCGLAALALSLLVTSPAGAGTSGAPYDSTKTGICETPDFAGFGDASAAATATKDSGFVSVSASAFQDLLPVGFDPAQSVPGFTVLFGDADCGLEDFNFGYSHGRATAEVVSTLAVGGAGLVSVDLQKMTASITVSTTSPAQLINGYTAGVTVIAGWVYSPCDVDELCSPTNVYSQAETIYRGVGTAPSSWRLTLSEPLPGPGKVTVGAGLDASVFVNGAPLSSVTDQGDVIIGSTTVSASAQGYVTGIETP